MKKKFFSKWVCVLVALTIGIIYIENCVAVSSPREALTYKNSPLTIVQDSGICTLRLFDLDGEPFGPTIDWKIDWPEGGEASVRNKIKTEIIRMLGTKIPKGKTIDNVTPDDLFQEAVKRYNSEYGRIKTPAQFKEEANWVYWVDGEECEATIEIWDDALVNITAMRTPNIMNGTPHTEILNELILLKTGESWNPSLLPSDSRLLPLVIKQWINLGYPREAVIQEGKKLLDVDSRYWTKDGLTLFYWKPWHLDIPDVEWFIEVTIPYRDLLPVLSSDAKRFIMPSILESVQDSSNNDLSEPDKFQKLLEDSEGQMRLDPEFLVKDNSIDRNLKNRGFKVIKKTSQEWDAEGLDHYVTTTYRRDYNGNVITIENHNDHDYYITFSDKEEMNQFLADLKPFNLFSSEEALFQYCINNSGKGRILKSYNVNGNKVSINGFHP